jgi:hypothetical protein
MVTSLYKWKILDRDVKQSINQWLLWCVEHVNFIYLCTSGSSVQAVVSLCGLRAIFLSISLSLSLQQYTSLQKAMRMTCASSSLLPHCTVQKNVSVDRGRKIEFTSRSWLFLWYWDVIIAREGLQTYDLRCSGQGSLSCHTCCDMGPRFMLSHPKGRPT